MKYILILLVVLASCTQSQSPNKADILAKLKHEQKTLQQVHELTVAAERADGFSAGTSKHYNQKESDLASEENKKNFEKVMHRIDSLQELLAK